MHKKATISVSGLLLLITLLFIGLKIMGIIAWNWWWVLSPLIVLFAGICTIFILTIVGMIMAIYIIGKVTNKMVTEEQKKLKMSKFQEKLANLKKD